MPIFLNKDFNFSYSPPSQTEQQEFSYQIVVQQVSENCERFEKHQTSFSEGKSTKIY
jgi:hypothetical protein